MKYFLQVSIYKHGGDVNFCIISDKFNTICTRSNYTQKQMSKLYNY
jgi:hypothetical protein